MKSKALWILLAAVAFSYGVYRLKYHWSLAQDYKSRPWAFSRDPGAKLLVGKWRGKFTDPGGVAKDLELEILSPVTEEEREKKAGHRTRKRKGLGAQEEKRLFSGTARIQSTPGVETYTISGSVAVEDFHQLQLAFIPTDEKNRLHPNFSAVRADQGSWQGDSLTLSVSFLQFNADGSSTSTSEGVVVDGQMVWKESPAEKPVVVQLSRQAPAGK